MLFKLFEPKKPPKRLAMFAFFVLALCAALCHAALPPAPADRRALALAAHNASFSGRFFSDYGAVPVFLTLQQRGARVNGTLTANGRNYAQTVEATVAGKAGDMAFGTYEIG